jgi:glycerol-3-phosphate dehydrogenase
MHVDVLIIGGGIIGCAIARQLTRYRLRVALLEREIEVGFGTSKANSGIIHGGHHTAADMLKGRLEWAGNQLWDSLCAELGFGFKRIGELTVALSPEQAPTLEQLLRNGKAKGIPGLEIWDRERTLAAEPNLTPTAIAALYAPATGVVNPYEACFGLAESAVRNGLHLMTGSPVVGLAAVEDGWLVRTPHSAITARFVINATGLYADRVADLAGVRTFSIHPRKGEEYLLDKRLRGLVQRVIFPCPTPVSKGILVIPTFDGTIMVGPTAHPTADREDRTTTAAGGDEVFAAVQQLVPGISGRDCIAEFAGLRAVADGGDFVIGPTTKKGFINVAGIQSPGLTAAPAIALMVADILCDEGLPLTLKDDFVPTLPEPIHFASLPTAAQMLLAAKDRRYSRLVCRCETVTEGEVEEAIARGARTLDGVKFRTRAGMGRCQGGFCTARCMEALARKLAIPVTAVTKQGGNSWIVRTRNEESP